MDHQNNSPSDLKVLHLEDTPTDAELTAIALKKAEILCKILVVDNKKDYIAALKEYSPDLILCDHSLLSIDSWEALSILKEHGLNIPFILVTSTVSEEYAVSIMKAGATDYILKDRMQRLPSAVLSALEKFNFEAERQKAEAIATEVLNERNTILERIGDAFFAVDKDWIVTYWNSMAEKVLGISKSKVLNNNLWKIFSNLTGSISYKKYHEAMQTGLAVHFEDYYQVLNKWYEISAYPPETGLSVYFKDVTDRRNSEMRLRDLNENLKKQAKELSVSNAELEQFAYVASHDLQEPLRTVTSFLGLLSHKYDDVLDAKGKQYVNFAVEGAKRMRQIILDLLDFSRAGRTDNDLEMVNIGLLIDQILTLYRTQIGERQARIEFDNLPTIQTHKTAIRQVFQNLIGNSLKYHKIGIPPVIIVSCHETRQHYKFAVKDNGIGIDAEYFDKIFVIFQRLHNKDEYSGTGIGLAVAKKIVEGLGGKIWVESEVQKGTVFYFTIMKRNTKSIMSNSVSVKQHGVNGDQKVT